MKKFLGTAVLGGVMLAGAIAPAFTFAAGSAPGYDNNPGRQQAGAVGAQCGTGAGSGAFGAFGPGVNFAGGANGYQTGLNNSAVCGNR